MNKTRYNKSVAKSSEKMAFQNRSKPPIAIRAISSTVATKIFSLYITNSKSLYHTVLFEWEINLFHRFHLCDSSISIYSNTNWKGTEWVVSCGLCSLDLAIDSAIRDETESVDGEGRWYVNSLAKRRGNYATFANSRRDVTLMWKFISILGPLYL